MDPDIIQLLLQQSQILSGLQETQRAMLDAIRLLSERLTMLENEYERH